VLEVDPFRIATDIMTATLRSNSGDSNFSIDVISSSEYAHDQGFDASIKLHGLHWDGDHQHPFSTSIDGIWLHGANLAALRQHIVEWLARPIERLTVEDLDAEFELACLPEQRLDVRLGSRQDTISHLNPVVSIEFSAGTIEGQFHFVTDQSCLAIFAQELSFMMQAPVGGLDG